MTRSLRTRLWSTIAILSVLLVALTGLAGPAQALTARKATVKVSKVYEYAGKSVTFSGTITKSPKGTKVKIQRKAGSRWVTAAKTKTTTASGKYKVVVKLPATPARYTYRAVSSRTSKLAPAISKTVVIGALRKTTATLSATPGAINAGQTSKLAGSVSPFVPGTKVSVQRKSGNAWVQVGSPALTSSGGFSLDVKPTTDTTYRVQTPLTGVNAGTVSAQRTVTVNNVNAPTITTTTLPDGDQNLAYTATLTKTGGAGTWSVPAGTLPGGLTLSAAGTLSGTPTGSGTRNLVITFTETSSGLTATKTLAITIAAAPTITTTTLPDAVRGTAYSATLTKSGAGAGTWTAPGLPAGLSINASTGAITGTTFVAVGEYGVYPVFTETGTGRKSGLTALSLKVGGTPLAITTETALPDGHRGAPYSVTFTKNGGPGTWTITEGGAPSLPTGFTLDPTTGTLSGTPTVAGTYAVFVTFTETGGTSVNKVFSLKVLQPKITTTSVPTAVTGTPYSVQLTKTGLDGTWELTSALPAEYSLSAAGLLTGDPVSTGDFFFQVVFTETSTGASTTGAFVLHVEAPGSPTITTASLPNGVIGTPYSATLAATPTGGTWSVTAGSLPVGFALNATTGAITGTPTVAEDAQFQMTYTNGGTKNTKIFRILVAAAP